jgi:hypothetical protein
MTGALDDIGKGASPAAAKTGGEAPTDVGTYVAGLKNANR